MAAVVLWFLLGLLAPVCPLPGQQDAAPPTHPQGFFKNLLRIPFERRSDFTPYVFSSWRPHRPMALNMMPDLLPTLIVPRVQVLCEDSLLTVLVDKRFGGVTLTKEDVQLGDGCLTTKDLPNRLVFTYTFSQCGTTREMKNGFGVFSNALHFNVQDPISARSAPSRVHISCMSRSPVNPNQQQRAVLPKTSRTFTMRAMNPSWTDTAASNLYTRGRTVHLQISADPRPREQLFVQSCFSSPSPEPEAQPRHPIILNKGCVTAIGSQHPVTKFVASRAANVVNVELNTTFMVPQMFVHCSVLLADQMVTSGSKSCNYNLIQSRWEELSGDMDVCSCCMSKCKGVSIKNLQEGAKAIVTAGPFFIRPLAQKPEVDLSVQDNVAATVEPRTPMALDQFLEGRVARWLPDQVQADDASKSDGDGETSLKLPEQPVKVAEKLPEAPKTSDLPDSKDETSVKHQDWQQWPPVIRSKLEISRSKDGARSLSYEEEVLMNDEGSLRRSKRRPGQKELMPSFLDLFRRMDKAE